VVTFILILGMLRFTCRIAALHNQLDAFKKDFLELDNDLKSINNELVSERTKLAVQKDK
jgi:hypothetical protein